MILSIIVAAAENNVIGAQGAIPWSLPSEQQYFRRVTAGKPVIMGRKTHESIGRVLPSRRNIVVTRQENAEFPGCEVVHSLEQAVELAREQDPEEIFVIGGEQLYREALPQADYLYYTQVHTEVEGDTRFPAIDPEIWTEISCEDFPATEKDPIAYTTYVYARKQEE